MIELTRDWAKRRRWLSYMQVFTSKKYRALATISQNPASNPSVRIGLPRTVESPVLYEAGNAIDQMKSDLLAIFAPRKFFKFLDLSTI